MSPEEKQKIFNQSLGDIASSYYTGDLEEFLILDNAEDEWKVGRVIELGEH